MDYDLDLGGTELGSDKSIAIGKRHVENGKVSYELTDWGKALQNAAILAHKTDKTWELVTEERYKRIQEMALLVPEDPTQVISPDSLHFAESNGFNSGDLYLWLADLSLKKSMYSPDGKLKSSDEVVNH